jgi:DNA-binding beta-propeller fold protein YncE
VASAPAAEEAPAFASEVLRFGSEGTGAGRFTDARSVAVDGAGRIYVAEYQGGRVQVFDSTGTFVTQWMADPEMPLLDLAADRTGTVYVVQSGRIRRYNGATGDPLGELPRRDRWTSYSDIALALDGTVWALEGRGPVVQLGRNGAVRRTIDVREAVKDASPGRVAVAGTGDVYVLDRTSGEVYRFGPDGRFVDRFGGRGEGRGSMESPEEIAIDGRGRVFVSDMGTGIHVFDQSGHFLDAFGGREVVFGLAFNDRDELFAAFRNRHQVARFRLNR